MVFGSKVKILFCKSGGLTHTNPTGPRIPKSEFMRGNYVQNMKVTENMLVHGTRKMLVHVVVQRYFGARICSNFHDSSPISTMFINIVFSMIRKVWTHPRAL
jgi:hypothetical protein